MLDLNLSHGKDSVDPKSILGVIVAIHAGIGELTRSNMTHKALVEDSVYFYYASYNPRSLTIHFWTNTANPASKLRLARLAGA